MVDSYYSDIQCFDLINDLERNLVVDLCAFA
jgi:hypothetical protein